MKKSLLFAAAILFAASANAQEVKVTKASDNPFKFSSTAHYYTILLDEETQAANLKEEQVTYLGPNGSWDDPSTTHFLDVWEGTLSGADATGKNSFGVPGGYQAWEILSGWYGCGYRIADKVDVSSIKGNGGFHFAVKSDDANMSYSFKVVSGAGEGKITVGGDNPLCDFTRDGSWYNFDISLADLQKLGVDFSKDNAFTGNLLEITQNADVTQGQKVYYDAIFFWVEGGADGIETVEAKANENAPVYNLAGQRVDKNFKGIAVKNGKKFMVK